VCKFICEVYFCPQYCFALFWWPILWSLQKFILVLNFIFNILNPLGVREEKKWLESDLRRERYHFNDFSYQNVKFLFQMVPYDEGSLNWLFFFYIKIEDWEEIGFRVDSWFWIFFLRFWSLNIGFTRLLWCFLSIFGWK